MAGVLTDYRVGASAAGDYRLWIAAQVCAFRAPWVRRTPPEQAASTWAWKAQSQAVWRGFAFRTHIEQGTWAAGWDRNCSVYVLNDDCPGATLTFATWSACREFMARRVE